MNEGTCQDIFGKLTKEDRLEAIELLVKNVTNIEEVEVFVSVLDLQLSSTWTTDNVKEEELDLAKNSIMYYDNEKEVLSWKKYNKMINSKKNIHEESKRFICDNCSKSFRWNADLKRHQLVHTGEKSHTCHICTKTFGMTQHLNRHMKNIHGIKTEVKTVRDRFTVNKFPCKNCDKQLSSLWTYKCHMRRYHDDKKEEIPCKKCDKKFYSYKSWYSHNGRVHKENKRYICEVCSKPWECKSDLERHRRVHTGEKPYTCPVCHKTFGQVQNLNAHLKLVHKVGTEKLDV